VINSGASLGINFPGLSIVQGILLLLLLWLWSREWRAWGWALVLLGGGLNFIEKIIFGGINDYWQIPGTNIYNNINDYLIGLGVIQIFWYFLWKKRQK